MERVTKLDLQKGAKVSGCLINGAVIDPHKAISAKDNVLDAPGPDFDRDWLPQSAEYKAVGYRPISRRHGTPATD